MKKKSFDPFKNLVLDPYEQEIEDAIENGDIHITPLSEKEKERYVQYARHTKELMKKDARVNIRVNRGDLNQIRSKAIEQGLRYQTLINAILHQYAKGKFSIAI